MPTHVGTCGHMHRRERACTCTKGRTKIYRRMTKTLKGNWWLLGISSSDWLGGYLSCCQCITTGDLQQFLTYFELSLGNKNHQRDFLWRCDVLRKWQIVGGSPTHRLLMRTLRAWNVIWYIVNHPEDEWLSAVKGQIFGINFSSVIFANFANHKNWHHKILSM